MKIVIDADTSGEQLKEIIARYAETQGHRVTVMCGDRADQYPEIAHGLAKRVASGQFDRGILICATGQGMAMMANKVTGIYAACCQDAATARNSASRKRAQVLTIGAANTSPCLAREIVRAFLDAGPDYSSRNAKRMRELERS